ncbi:hypothetical protein K1719_016453 [Acacia pycnantha]|nr:hypothetical protein K1719_016453 [Acacia pycnantha]
MHILRVWVDRLQQTLSQHPKLRVTQSIETPSLTFPALGLPFGKTSVRRSTSSPPDRNLLWTRFLNVAAGSIENVGNSFRQGSPTCHDLHPVFIIIIISSDSILSIHHPFSSILFTMVRRASLKDLDDSTDRWAVVVRVFRKWNVYQKSAPAESFCVTMVLIDEEYRATSHPFKITFTSQTYSAEDIATIPSYAYSFFPIPEIMKIDFRHPVHNLVDVLAFVKDVGTLDEFRRGNETKNRLRLLLADSENNEVECTLFDNCASDAYMAYLQNTESPVVVLLNFARVGFSEDGNNEQFITL